MTSPSWGGVATVSPATFIARILHIAGATLAFSNNRLSICYLLSAFNGLAKQLTYLTLDAP
ncbi:MAG: hypothetical protein MK001_09250 [Alcanivorax sp.]|nr:hypothetical protein [Alcanivorax sp.]